MRVAMASDRVARLKLSQPRLAGRILPDGPSIHSIERSFFDVVSGIFVRWVLSDLKKQKRRPSVKLRCSYGGCQYSLNGTTTTPLIRLSGRQSTAQCARIAVGVTTISSA